MSAIDGQYLRAWHHVLALADGVDQQGWAAPSPCPGWTGAHVAGHLIDAAHQTTALLAGQPPIAATGDPDALRALAGADPAQGLREAADPLLARVGQLDPEALLTTGHGDLPADRFLGMALVEPVIHGWDLATATGSPAVLDNDAVHTLLAGAQAMGDQLAATGMYAPALPVPDTADPQQHLLALLGRAG